MSSIDGKSFFLGQEEVLFSLYPIPINEIASPVATNTNPLGFQGGLNYLGGILHAQFFQVYH